MAFLKPSEIIKSVVDINRKTIPEFDTISNDWYKTNKTDWQLKPKQDSSLNRVKFGVRPEIEFYSKSIIDSDLVAILWKIKTIFDKQRTDYKIIITPDYNQLHINLCDLKVLKTVFGDNNVYDFTGKNSLTEDKYNFMDIMHFDKIVGWKILRNIYINESIN